MIRLTIKKNKGIKQNRIKKNEMDVKNKKIRT